MAVVSDQTNGIRKQGLRFACGQCGPGVGEGLACAEHRGRRQVRSQAVGSLQAAKRPVALTRDAHL